MANSLEQLAEIFKKFPGIGPRQAKRFVYHLLRQSPGNNKQLADLIENLKEAVIQCPDCQRFYFPSSASQKEKKLCDICADPQREPQLLIVEKDLDLETIRKSAVYQGYYFVLGGLIPILVKNPEQTIRLAELKKILAHKKSAGQLKEIILALTANTEGDYTADFLRQAIAPLFPDVKISLLGRGLSTGTELEYSDSDTLKNALKNRS